MEKQATFVQEKKKKLSKFALFLVVLDNAVYSKRTGIENYHHSCSPWNPLANALKAHNNQETNVSRQFSPKNKIYKDYIRTK